MPTLPRTGRQPLEFEGEIIAQASGRTVNAPAARDNSDWWEITIYALPESSPHIPCEESRSQKEAETLDGTPPTSADASSAIVTRSVTATYVVAIRYTNSHRDRQYHHDFAEWTDEPAETLAEYDPLAVLRGFPPGDQYAARQQALERSSRAQYDLLVSTVLQEFPERLDTGPLARAKRLAAQLRRTIAEIAAADQDDEREAIDEAVGSLNHLDCCLTDIAIGPLSNRR